MKNLTSVAVISMMPLSVNALALEDDELTLGYRNYYWKERSFDRDEGYKGKRRDEWVHAFLLDYSTGYLGGLIKFDYGAAIADDLYVGRDIDEVSNLPTDKDLRSPHSLSGTRKAYASVKVPVLDDSLNVGYGKKSRASNLFMDSNTRILPSTTVGWDADMRIGPARLYYSSFDRYTPRNGSEWGGKLTNFLGEEIDRVDYYGVDIQVPDRLTLNVQELEAHEYIRERFARADIYAPGLPSNSRLKLRLTYGSQSDAGDLFETGGLGGYAPPGNSLNVRYLEQGLSFTRDAFTYGLARIKVYGGDFNRVLFKDDAGTWETSGNGWSFYGLEGEETYTASLSVDFAAYAIPGLRWDVWAKRSHGAKGYDDFSRRELSSFLSYAFQGSLRGLSLAMYTTFHRASGVVDGIERTVDVSGPAQLERKDVYRFYLNYTKKF